MSTYTLSWEEFLEFNQGSLPGPSIASFVAMIFMAVAVGAFGGVLTYAVDPQSRWTASIFCWLSLALFLGAFWDLRVRTARRRRRATGELRRAYEHFYSGERTFTFDEQKWNVETRGSRQESSWASLLSAVEWPNVVSLAAQDQLSTAIPKRTLTARELDSLRDIAITSTASAWESRVSLPDYLLTEVPSLWRRHPFLMAEAHAGGLLWVLMIATDMYHETGPGAYVGWILAVMILFLTITSQFWYFLIKYRTSHKELGESWKVSFSEKGVHIKASKFEFFRSWAHFRKFGESTRCLLLYVNSSLYYMLPKRCLPARQESVLRELARAKLG